MIQKRYSHARQILATCRRSCSAMLVALVASMTGLAGAGEPCVPGWDATIGELGLDASPNAVFAYDGELICGGFFSTAGGVPANRIARWDGSSWQPFGAGMDNLVRVLTEYNGDLIAGGLFSTADGVSASSIARWDGTSWHALGTGLGGWALALTAHDDNLIAGGTFTSAGGVSANRIAKWDGSSWQALGSGMDDMVLALTVYNGDLIAAGAFTSAGGQAASRIARWDSVAGDWQPLGSGLEMPGSTATVYALAVYNGELIAAGEFTVAGGVSANHIARWNGTSWQPLGSGLEPGVGGPAAVAALTVYNGKLIVGGEFLVAGGLEAGRIARWDGSVWDGMSTNLCPGAPSDGCGMGHAVLALTKYNNELIAAGSFTSAFGLDAERIIAFDDCVTTCASDIDGNDNEVNVFDLLELLANWGTNGNGAAIADPTNIVDVFDLLGLLSAWGDC